MGSGIRQTLTTLFVIHDALLLLQQVWDTPSIAMKLPFATPSPSRRPSEAGSHAGGPDSEVPEHPWGLVLSQFATVARHDPRREVCWAHVMSQQELVLALLTATTLHVCCALIVMNYEEPGQARRLGSLAKVLPR